MGQWAGFEDAAELVRISGVYGYPALAGASADGDVLMVSAGQDGVYRWDPETGERLWRAEGTYEGVQGLAVVCAEGVPVLAAGTEMTGMMRWDARTGEQLPGCDPDYPSFWDVDTAVLPDGRAIVVGAGDNDLFRMDALTGELIDDPSGRQWRAFGGVRRSMMAVRCCTLGDGTVAIVAGTRSAEVLRIDALTGQPLGPALQLDEGALCVPRLATVDLSDGATLIVGADFEGRIRRWNLHTGEPVGEPIDTGVRLPQLAALRLAGEPVLITSGNTQAVRCRHAVTGELLGIFPHIGRSWCTTGPDGAILLAGTTRAGDLTLYRLGSAEGTGG
ncbi:WD40 repeat domain-containing protein [Kitasatospora sp. NPDC094028]